jgi:hypothetical protein
MQDLTKPNLARDATYWSLPRARLARVLGRRVHQAATFTLLDRAPVIFFRFSH